jgi:hypothetical protein
LIELMLSAALGMLVLGAAVAVLLSAGRIKHNQQLLSDANEEARQALRRVARSLSSAGAGGAVYTYVDGSGARQQRPSLLFTNGTVALHDPSLPQTPDELILMRYAPDRRTVLVGALVGNPLRVAPDPRDPGVPGVQPTLFREGESALITNFQRAMLLPISMATLNTMSQTVDLDVGAVDAAALQDPLLPIEPGAAVFPVKLLRYRLVYVPPNGTLPQRSDLVEEILDPRTLAPLQQVVLARDIEDFQVQWAYDRNDDGVADDTGAGAYGDEGPTSTVMDPALLYARISVSARTSEELIGGDGQGVRVAGDTPFERGLDLGGPRPAASGHRRRVLSTVVLLKNLASTRI